MRMSTLTVVCITLLSLLSLGTARDTIKCYQCPDITKECPMTAAIGNLITCAGLDAHCTTRIRIEQADFATAVRKCVANDPNDICPEGWKCINCEDNFCNSGITHFGTVWMTIGLAAILYLFR